MPEDEAKRLQVLDEENAQLKRVIAEQSQDVSMLQDLTQGEILSAARRREAVDYLVDRYRISERRACRLVGQHRSTQRYGTSDREDNGFANGSPTGHAGFDDENTRGQAGSGPVPSQGWRPSLVEVPEEPWPTEGAEVRRLGSMEEPDDERRRPPGRAARIPFLDHRIPCFRRLRTSLVHDVVWLARDSETARLLGADVLIFGLQDLATTPRRLVHLMPRGRRGHGALRRHLRTGSRSPGQDISSSHFGARAAVQPTLTTLALDQCSSAEGVAFLRRFCLVHAQCECSGVGGAAWPGCGSSRNCRRRRGDAWRGSLIQRAHGVTNRYATIGAASRQRVASTL